MIEAAPERLEIKRELFGRLSEQVVSDDCVLATNTSSLLVTAIASAAKRPERVVGMHFFNPPPIMRLLEVVAGEQSSEEALARARATGEAMGKHVIEAVDGPGFLVNRCNRPFGLEALKLLEERVAPIEQIDRICRLGGRLPDGPVRADGSRRRRRRAGRVAIVLRAELRRAALAPVADHGPDRRRGPRRAQGRARLLRLRRRDPVGTGLPTPSRARPATATGWS